MPPVSPPGLFLIVHPFLCSLDYHYDSLAAGTSSRSTAVLPAESAEQPTWCAVDLRFVIATIVIFGTLLAASIRLGHELFARRFAESRRVDGCHRASSRDAPGKGCYRIYKKSADHE
ncbi:MAG TPA: hypothetical protein VFS39_10090 [Nitrospira sp.]|nr:hypothetical protein [Nitrospira sp.]